MTGLRRKRACRRRPRAASTSARAATRAGDLASASSSARASVRTAGNGPVRTSGGIAGAGGPATAGSATCAAAGVADVATSAATMADANRTCMYEELLTNRSRAPGLGRAKLQLSGYRRRSEEHTCELQSLMRISYAVFCLKKKKQQ